MDDRRQTFHELHRSGCFVMPNPWDAGSARLLVQLGFRALATTSAGLAWSRGSHDTGVSLADTLDHLRLIAGSVGVPVNADLEGGFAIEPEAVAANVAAATVTGIAGLSIEDATGVESAPIFDFTLAVERISAARSAIDATGSQVLLTGRSEGLRFARPDFKDTIRRLVAYSEAGADCLYAPGIRTLPEIVEVVRAVAPKPVNVLVGSDFTTVAQLAEAGVRRISVGGGLARVAVTAFTEAASEIAGRGTFLGLGRALPFADVDGMFRQRSNSGQA